MALLKIESGEVKRHVGSRGAFVVEEQVTLPDGRSFPKSFTVWYEGDNIPAVGSLVSVIGKFSAKTREYPAPSGMKTAVDISINEPEVNVLHAVAEPKTEEVPF